MSLISQKSLLTEGFRVKGSPYLYRRGALRSQQVSNPRRQFEARHDAR